MEKTEAELKSAEELKIKVLEQLFNNDAEALYSYIYSRYKNIELYGYTHEDAINNFALYKNSEFRAMFTKRRK